MCQHDSAINTAATRSGMKTYNTQWLFRCCFARIIRSALVATRISDHTTIQRRAGGNAFPNLAPAIAGSASAAHPA
jgi:hypothetical protein